MLRRLKHHKEFIAHVGSIVSGRSAAALIGLVLTPVVSRLFEPGDFGVAASFLAMAGIAAQLATLRYDAAFALPKDDGEALLLVALTSRIMPAYCVFVLVAVAVMDLSDVSWPALDEMGAWIWFLPVTVFMMSAQDIQEAWLARKKKFAAIGRSVVVDSAIGGASRIGFGLGQGSSVHGLIFGHLLGVTGRLVMQGRAEPGGAGIAFGRVQWHALRDIARRYSDFPRLSAPAALVFATGQNLPVLMFGAMFSPAAAGFFAMANRLSRMPVQIVTNSVSRVFMQKAATIHNSGRPLTRPLALSTSGLLALGALPAAVVWAYGQEILGWLLGSRWYVAGAYMEVIAPWVLAAWVTAPCNPVFTVLRKQKYWLSLQIVLTLLRIGVFVVGYLFGLAEMAILRAFVAVAVAGNLITIATAFSLAARAPAQQAR
jgi:O-antigen/teichoic acid export membrane protein